jgi:hypothetical protein
VVSVVVASAIWFFSGCAVILQVGYVIVSADLAAEGIFAFDAEVEHRHS